MDKKLKTLTDQELEQTHGGIVVTSSGGEDKNSCKLYSTETACLEHDEECKWEENQCVPQVTTRLL